MGLFPQKIKGRQFHYLLRHSVEDLTYSRLRTLYLCLAAPNILIGLLFGINELTSYSHITTWIFPLNLIAGLLLISAALPLTKKINHLEKEQKILE